MSAVMIAGDVSNSLAADRCFRCGEPAGYPRVEWLGAGAKAIALHPNCAARLALHLAFDAQTANGDFAIGVRLDNPKVRARRVRRRDRDQTAAAPEVNT